MGIGQSSRTYFSTLDGVRGFASLLVITHHNFHYINILNYNQFGTDLFFVLSGFLITTVLLNTNKTRHAISNFYIRRVLRVFPLYYLSLLIFLLLLPGIQNIPIKMEYYVENQTWLWLFLQNWLYIFKDPNPFSALNHLWSMVIEEQFYLFWPLIILIFPKSKNLLAFVSALYVLFIVFRMLIWFAQIDGLAYYNLFSFTKVDGIFVGCMVAILHKRQSNIINDHCLFIMATLILINLSFIIINSSFELGLPYFAFIGYITFSILFGLLINFLIIKKSSILHTIFELRLLKSIGKISYGTYIFHWPLYLLISPIFQSFFINFFSASISTLIISIIATIIAYLIGFLTYNFFEIRFLKLGKRYYK